MLEISEGDGIRFDNVGGVTEINVDLATNSGLEFVGGDLSVADEIAGSGLTWTTGVLSVNARTVGATGDEIAVRFGTGNCPFVDKDDFSYTTAANGLSKFDCNVTLGGALTGDTTIDGATCAYDLNLSDLAVFSLSFNEVSTITDFGSNGGIINLVS